MVHRTPKHLCFRLGGRLTSPCKASAHQIESDRPISRTTKAVINKTRAARAGKLPLGLLRNIAVAQAKGNIVCQWDDDDLYHRDRTFGGKRALAAKHSRLNSVSSLLQM